MTELVHQTWSTRFNLVLAAIVLAVCCSAPVISDAHAQTATQEAAKELFDEGFKLYQSGDFYAAKDSFETGLELSPTNPAAHYYLGRILEQQGDFGGARASYEAAIANGADTKEGILAQSKLQGLDQRAGERAIAVRDRLLRQFSGEWCGPVWAKSLNFCGNTELDEVKKLLIQVDSTKIVSLSTMNVLRSLSCAIGQEACCRENFHVGGNKYLTTWTLEAWGDQVFDGAANKVQWPGMLKSKDNPRMIELDGDLLLTNLYGETPWSRCTE